jgi:hypothetical protein
MVNILIYINPVLKPRATVLWDQLNLVIAIVTAPRLSTCSLPLKYSE